MQGSPVVYTPALIFPSQGGKMYPGSPATASGGNSLLWYYDPNASSWLVELADNPAMINPAVQHYAAANYFQLSPELLQAGKTWYWRITALGGISPAVSAVWKFEVSNEYLPVAKPKLSTVPQLAPIIFGANIGNWEDLDPEIAANNEMILSRVVLFLNANSKYRALVEGHANPTANPADTEGRWREQTQELLPMSELRAMAIVDMLVERSADPLQLEFYGFGGERPIAAWDDVSNWWKNRRVEFVLVE